MRLTIEIEVPLSRIADLLCCAIESNGSMWAQIIRQRKPKKEIDLAIFEGRWDRVYPHLHYSLFEGGSITVTDTWSDEKKTYVLDLFKIQNGLKIFSEKTPRHFGDFLSDNDDAETGDVFLQCCLFGEVKYG